MAKIAMVVSNPCAPDHRVVKQAEFLASQGHHVRIYCKAARGVPRSEIVHGVEYYRIPFSVRDISRRIFFFWKSHKESELSL